MDDHRKINTLRELFRGRFAFEEAQRLLTYHNGNVHTAAMFVLESEPQRVREVCRTDNEGWQIVRNNAAWRELARLATVSHEERQYACGPCDNVWWRKVPSRKPVSKCRRCRVRYNAIPRNREWGWAEYTCGECSHVFGGFGQMENTWSPCFGCTVPCLPTKIFPRRRRRSSRRNQDRHSCCSRNCFNNAGRILPGICVHPKSLRRGERAVVPSNQHASTGSTVDTFLTQDDLASQISFDSNLSDVDEGNGD